MKIVLNLSDESIKKIAEQQHFPEDKLREVVKEFFKKFQKELVFEEYLFYDILDYYRMIQKNIDKDETNK
jgi:hypothetical protein